MSSAFQPYSTEIADNKDCTTLEICAYNYSGSDDSDSEGEYYVIYLYK